MKRIPFTERTLRRAKFLASLDNILQMSPVDKYVFAELFAGTLERRRTDAGLQPIHPKQIRVWE